MRCKAIKQKEAVFALERKRGKQVHGSESAISNSHTVHVGRKSVRKRSQRNEFAEKRGLGLLLELQFLKRKRWFFQKKDKKGEI